jgi:hypothetical protein
MIWGQTRSGAQVSAPSPQVQLRVAKTAIRLGGTQFTYETLYLMLALLLAAVLIGLAAFIVHHVRHARKKHALVQKQVAESQESLRRGFAVLNRDIQAELEILRQAKLSQKLSIEERVRETQLLKDLEDIEQYLAKEIWDIEKAGQ